MRRRDDGPARGQASLAPRITRDQVAYTLVAAAVGAAVLVATKSGPGPEHDVVLAVVLACAGLWWGTRCGPALLAGAHSVPAADAPVPHVSLRALADRARVRVPRLDVSLAREPIAFTTGRSRHAARITVSSGLLALLDDDELDAVLAREVARVRAGGTFAATLALLLSVAAVLATRVVVVRPHRIPPAVAYAVRIVASVLVEDDACLDAHASRLARHNDALGRARAKLAATRDVRTGPHASTLALALALLERDDRREHGVAGGRAGEDGRPSPAQACTRARPEGRLGAPRAALPRR